MRPRVGKKEDEFVVVFFPNQEPIGFDMAFPTAFIIAR